MSNLAQIFIEDFNNQEKIIQVKVEHFDSN